MRLTVVGCGDAFGTGGRSHSCYRLDAQGRTLLADFGASAILGWRRLGFDTGAIDAVVLSHLHGDHFGGLPFLLLDRQFTSAGRGRNLIIAGPPGTRERLDALIEVTYPAAGSLPWRFDWSVVEIPPGGKLDIAGFSVETREVVHASGAPSTGLRIGADGRLFAFSGDTEWTDALFPLCRGADLFVTECYSGKTHVTGHLDWPTLRDKLPLLDARRRMVTHMGPSALPLTAEFEAAGLLVAYDGLVIDL
ncbi:MAG: Beta-lactamase domain protein [Hyphomicrobiales bacterium]|nr:Beta-lactamase domain protein [Hyphomicrobiales bacterium]